MWVEGEPIVGALIAFCAVIAPGTYLAFMLTLLIAARQSPLPHWVGRDAALGVPLRNVVDARSDDARHHGGADQDRGSRVGGNGHRHVRGLRADRSHSVDHGHVRCPRALVEGRVDRRRAAARARRASGRRSRRDEACGTDCGKRRARLLRGVPAAVAAREQGGAGLSAAVAARSSSSASTHRSRPRGR